MTARRRRRRTTPSAPMQGASRPRSWPGCQFFRLPRLLLLRRRQCRRRTNPGPTSLARRAPRRRTPHPVTPCPRHRRRPTLRTLRHHEAACRSSRSSRRYPPHPRLHRCRRHRQCRRADAAARARHRRLQAATAAAEARGLLLRRHHLHLRRGRHRERPPLRLRPRLRRPLHA